MTKTLFDFFLLSTLFLYLYSLPALAVERANLTSDQSNATVFALKVRAGYQRNLNDLILLFGDKLPVSQVCYQTAVSNYIEDMWNDLVKADGCESTDALCGKDQQAMKGIVSNLQLMGLGIHNEHDRQAAILFVNTQYIITRMYKALRQLYDQLDPENEAASFFSKVESSEKPKTPKTITEDDKKKMAEFNTYVDSCNMRTPAPWSVVGVHFAANQLTQDIAKVSMQKLLIEALVTNRLPTDDKGYVGCLRTLIDNAEKARNICKDKSCADNVAMDAKQDLTTQLAELKTHQCAATYAYQMQARTQ